MIVAPAVLVKGDDQERLLPTFAVSNRLVDLIHEHFSCRDTRGDQKFFAHRARELEENSGFNIQLSLPEGDEKVSEALSFAVYRILQELLSNAIKHSNGSRIDVTLRLNADTLSLQVADNGRGLPPSIPQGEHFGLLGIRERLKPLW